MKIQEYRKQLNKNPDYIAAKKKLRPYLILANNVLNLRIKQGWTQSELAIRTGTKQANISRIESGLSNPTVQFLQKLANVFDVEIKDLLQENDSNIMKSNTEIEVVFVRVSEPGTSKYDNYADYQPYIPYEEVLQ